MPIDPAVTGTLAQWVSAGATFCAVIVALFGDRLRAQLLPPKLSLRLDDTLGERAKSLLTWTDENGADQKRMEDCRAYRLVASNSRRWSPARGVRIVVLQIEDISVDGRWHIHWTGSLPLIWMHQPLFPPARDIGDDAHADFYMVVKDKWAELQAAIIPHNLAVRQRQGFRWRLAVQARGVETDSNVLQLEVSWDGKWEEGT